MSVTLYYDSGSAYAWRVWLALEHKGVQYDWKLLSFSEGGHKTPDYTRLNPRQRVYAIVQSKVVHAAGRSKKTAINQTHRHARNGASPRRTFE